MFYSTTKGDCPFKIDPFKALVGPRPIGWISSLSENGIANLAPYSFFNAVSSEPPIIMFSSVGRKDSIKNIEATGEFVCNLATIDLSEAVNQTSLPLPAEDDEFEAVGIEKAKCNLVSAPRVALSPVALECKFINTVDVQTLENQPSGSQMVLGQVVGVHIDDQYIENDRVNTARLKQLARHGYMDYSVSDETFRINRPKL